MEEILQWLLEPVPGLENATKSWVGAAIMGATAIASLIGNAIKNKKEQNRTNRANMELAKYQASQNEALVDKQNQYNTPVNQMMRYDQAGLNPNLVYGQGTPGNQPTPARYEAPTLDYRTPSIDLPAVLSQYQDFQMKQAQIENVQSATSLNYERNMLAKLTGRRGEFDFSQDQKLAPYDLNIRMAEKLQAYRKLNLLDAEVGRIGQRDQMINQDIQRRNQELFFNEHRNYFKSIGINDSDNFFVRVLARAAMSAGFDVSKMPNNIRR